jgi:hypothetical protein
LTIAQILAWADAHHRRTGHWPQYRTQASPAPGITWNAIHWALYYGHRGLAGGSSLAKLLVQHRGVPVLLRTGRTVTVDAKVCAKCGERYYGPEAMRRLEAARGLRTKSAA